MNREYHRWYSQSLSRDMEMLAFGYAGARVLIFPTSLGRFFEWEDRGMMGCLGEQLERGWIQVFCVDSVDAESWYNKRVHPHVRARRHAQYDQYILHEVVPFTTWRNANPFLMTVGASFGAYHALSFALRYPHLVGRVIGLSGLYDIRMFTDGYSDDEVYFHNPFDFVVNEHEPWRLEALRRMDIILASGRDDPHVENSRELSARLWRRGIGNALRIWDGWAHDWPYWQTMIRHYIGGHD